VISNKIKKIVSQKGKSHWLNRKSNTKEFINTLKKHFSDLKGLKILDAGCAQGRDSAEIAKFDGKVVGLDYSKEFIKEAKLAHPEMTFKQGHIEKLPFLNNTFDAVYCVNTLFYTKLDKSLPELERVLKPNGILFITLDEKIINLDNKKTIYSSSVPHSLHIFKKAIIINKVYMERIDGTPFKHKHFFYEITLKKTSSQNKKKKVFV
jgi:ubiquinone/menaquinone biosynthesis C-methylase UbiE